jgi:23S rRNA (guanosine2251-2'-O)-methyltransferase
MEHQPAVTERHDRHQFSLLARRPIRVVLDRVKHLPNIGTMFRLCDAFRVEHLYICGVDLQPHKRKLVKAAAGTLPWVPWQSRADAAAIVRESKDAGYCIAAVELAEHSLPPEALRVGAPLCLVLGAERQGVSPELLELADQCIQIPTDGMGGSINLTTAAAIVLYQAARSRGLKA